MTYKSVLLLVSALGLSACSTVKMPNLDFLSAGFQEDLENIDQSVPSVSEVPEIPNDVRSTTEWDQSAREMIRVRDSFTAPVAPEEPISEQEFNRRFEQLKSDAQEYKKDDPQ